MWCNTREKRILGNVFVLVCDFNEKLLKKFYMFCVHLGYVESNIV